MNPTNPFGSPQGGAFQAPSSTLKTGMFQSFGQQSSSNPPQTMGFFPSQSEFGQPPVLNQTSTHATNIFGQPPAFGQPSTQQPSLPTLSQTPSFGQPSIVMSSSGFGSGTAPAFGQASGPNQGSVFGKTPSFREPLFGHAPGFSKPPPAYNQQQPSGFGNSQMASGSTVALGQPQPPGFGQSVFGPTPSSTSVSTSLFGTTQNVNQMSQSSRGFGPTKFSFKPANEALFKPIFSTSPEPTNPQTTPMSSSHFGSAGSQNSSSTLTSSSTTGFSALAGAKSGPLGFSFSQLSAAPSISTQNNPSTTGTSSTAPNTLQFTFSQPAATSSSSTKPSTTQPTTPSSFSFSTTAPHPQAAPLFGGRSFGQPSSFGDTKAKTETSTDQKGSNFESLVDTNVFARLGKGTKRKEDLVVPGAGLEKTATEEDPPEGTDSPRHPSKRPLMRSCGPPVGLFGRALSSLRRDGSNTARRDTQQQASTWEDTGDEDVPVLDEDRHAAASTARTLTGDLPQTAQESAKDLDPNPETSTPVKRGIRRESSESLSGMSPTDSTSLHCKKIPPNLNKKDVLEKHFGRFGKVCKVICRPAKLQATVTFDDHASAAKAKKKGKILHGQELFLLWQRKRPSPGEKGSRPAAGMEEAESGSQQDPEPQASSPLRRPAVRAAAPVSSMVGMSRSSPLMKSSLAKSLQFDSEPQRVSSTEAHSSERPVPSSLLHLIGQLADNAEDKYRLLEQRDKILRQGRPKRTDLNLSKAFVGTCPDMCPEKERYMRETRKQLSIYELIPDTEMVAHAAAIKEYSRSSADQEEPLPHELRPLPVLSMTMDYLVTQIMDQGQDNYRDWYDFVWNRTRGIRKDIIQQHLCCPHTVSLIEKCTRFHVHCAHHLCEEKINSFDAKINNENMTKCLQSLKEMYQDLAMSNIYCPLEAEFRQYNVLLKLDDGDVLREVQKFREEVRNSPEVKFAVQAFSAVSSNNFVRFFKLVKGASYLSSCLLHRYFNQVRAKALKTLNIAHTVGPRSTLFPVEDIVRMLMFRSADEAADFIQQYGLNINDGMVELNRINYQEPDLPLSQKKSDVILVKKTVLIGAVVNGGPLPASRHHTPILSFDSQNKYRGQGPLAETPPCQFKAFASREAFQAPPSVELPSQVVSAQVSDVPTIFVLAPAVTDETGEPINPIVTPGCLADAQQLFKPIAPPQPVKPPSPPPISQLVYNNEDIVAVLDHVIDEVVEAAAREIASAGASYVSAALVESSAQAESVVSEVLRQMLQETSSSEIQLEQERVATEKRQLEEARRRQEHEAFLVQFSFSLCKEIIYEVLDKTIKETAKSEIQDALNEKANRVAKCTEHVCSSLVEETLNADIALLVEDVLEAELQHIHKYIKRWRDVVAVRRQLKRQMRGFPAAPCCVDPRSKLKALAPSAPPQPSIADLTRGLVNLGNAGTLALSSTKLLKMRQEAVHQMRVHYFYQRLLDETMWAPLDLPALVTENIPDPPERIFWKAVVLLPSDHESAASLADSILSDWLELKLGGGNESEAREEQQQLDGTLQTLCVYNTLQDKDQRTHKVHISVKASRGPLTEAGLSKMEECCELHGTGALITLLPALPTLESGYDEPDVPLLSALLQLKQLQQANTWHCPVPLVILVPSSDRSTGNTHKLEEALMLQTLVKEGLISDYIFLLIPETTSDLQGSKQLSLALHWLLARAPPPVSLSCQNLVQLVEASLSLQFTPRVYSQHQERAAAGLPPQAPGPVIQLYSALLSHIADTVSSQELGRLSWPPGEFCLPDTRHFVPHLGWNSDQHLAWLRNAILSLQLPQWDQLSATDSWSEVCSSIFHYASQIPVSPRSQPLLMSRLENLLERVRLNNHRIPNHTSQNVAPSFSQIPWDDILVICIDHKLKDWKISGPPVSEDAVTEDGEILVYFSKEVLSGFRPPEEWSQTIRHTHKEKHQEKDGASAAACAPSNELALRQRLFQSRLEPVESPLDITHTPTGQELLANKVLQSIKEEKAESQRIMEQFQRWLDSDSVDQLSTPLFIPSSTLMSMTTTLRNSPRDKRLDSIHTKEPEPDDLSDKMDQSKTRPVSIAWRLKELERQILASQEEELACKLNISGLLSIVDD